MATPPPVTPAGPPASEEDAETFFAPDGAVTGAPLPGGVAPNDLPTGFTPPPGGDPPIDLPTGFIPPPGGDPTTDLPTGFTPMPSGGTRAAGAAGPLVMGQNFGSRYHIIRILGVGGMGAVYQAWDEELGVAVALKIIRPETASDPAAAAELERRFKRELLLARQVTHRNVVRIHDLGDVNGIKYITMPYIEGEDLATVLKRDGRLSVPQLMRIARPIVAGMVAAHEAGIVHRDLKPANIMLERDGEALVTDFGIARSAGGPGGGPAPKQNVHLRDLQRHAAFTETVAGAVVGTAQYMAPEQAKGQPVDQRADIYALGLIFYDMLVGRSRSEHAESAIAELQARMLQAPPPVRSIAPDVPETLEKLISRCLDPDPAKRFQTSKELQAALDRLDENGKPLPIIRRLTRRTVIAAAALVLVLLGATFYVTLKMTAPPKEHEPVSVLIADFQNNTNDPAFDHTLGHALRRALEGASFITAVDRTRIRPTFGVQAPEKFDAAAARQLAIKQGLGVVLAGSIAPSDGGYEISATAMQPLTGNVITSVTRRASRKDDVLETLTRLVTSVRKSLGDETSDSAQLLAMRNISTTSLDVASHYAGALDAQSRGDDERALESFARAVQLDPKFGLGYQGLATINGNLGRLQEAEKYASQALQYLDMMTERERFLTRGTYFIRTGDYQQCVKEYGELIARYPADHGAHNQRALCLARLRDMRGAVTEMRKAVNILPNSVLFRSNLAATMNYAGDFAGAMQEIKAIQEPGARTLSFLALAQLGQGLAREAAETYNKLSTMGAWGASYAAAGLGDLASYEGRFSDAVRILEEGAAADIRAQNPDAAAMKLTAAAYAHLSRGQRALAATAAEKALQNSTVAPIRFLAARIFVETGSLSRARKLAAEFSSQVLAEPQAYGKIIEGGIALKSRDAAKAIKILTEANGILDTWLGHFDLGRAFLEVRAYPQADSEFDRCIQRRGEALALLDEDPTYGYYPAVYYYRGRVREELKTAGFADAYREYLKIRGASTEDPLVPDVRRRVGSQR